MSKDTDDLLAERQDTHGNYTDNARITWDIMRALQSGRHWDAMHDSMKETLHMTAHKMHRIVNGDPYFKDHWVDFEGYARLVNVNWDTILEQRPPSGLRLTPDEIDLVLRSRMSAVNKQMRDAGLRIDIAAAQRTMAAEMAVDRAGRVGRIVTHETEPTHLFDSTGVRVDIGDPVYVNGRRDAGELAAIKTHGDVERPLLVRFRPEHAEGRDLEDWFPLLGTVYARHAAVTQEPQSRVERRVPRYDSQAPLELAVRTSASAAAPTPVPAEPRSPGTPEDGGHHADAAEAEELPFSSEVRREPRVATWKEFQDLGSQLIGHGSREGDTWHSIYDQNSAGSFTMHPDHQDEYGR